MSDVPDGAGPSSTRRWALVYVLLTPAVVLPLWVSLYDREDPTFLGFPFYYWFQFALIVIAVSLTVPAYLLAKGADRADRQAHGLPPEPTGQQMQEGGEPR
ncbi:DUF3311 domain-containing protein [Nocardioides sp. YIM 152315]|uniref:DUF3311 domain-containing protein n=1 Tax=Nocardioides sp. YIM 152315 TaxID=3031760 RepID=UPI0023DAE8AC|nr:DUF3311 domain-containing protein [Nocardioides sp. YIM 152315]MDF1604382.1 DUF3311 domain-containing protein [Nocardioides sp. YIM 152315]